MDGLDGVAHGRLQKGARPLSSENGVSTRPLTLKGADMKKVAKAVFSIDGDDSGYVFEGTVMSYEGRYWLVSTWLLRHGTTERIPEWLVPLEALGHQGPVQGEVVALGTAVPRGLIGLDASLQALQRAGAVRNPLLVDNQKPGNVH